MEMISLEQELQRNAYPGRGISSGRVPTGPKRQRPILSWAEVRNSRNRVFVEDGEGIRTQAFDPSKMTDPSLIIYAPVRVLGNRRL